MKVEVGFITAWRRAIFFTAVLCIILFGFSTTICQNIIGKGLISNVVMVFVLMLCIIFFILVLADKWGRYEDIGTAIIDNGKLIYNDKKRHFNIALSDMTKVDIEEVLLSSKNSISSSKKVLAYRILIQVGKKKYYIESDQARGRSYQEVDLYNLYLYINEKRG